MSSSFHADSPYEGSGGLPFRRNGFRSDIRHVYTMYEKNCEPDIIKVDDASRLQLPSCIMPWEKMYKFLCLCDDDESLRCHITEVDEILRRLTYNEEERSVYGCISVADLVGFIDHDHLKEALLNLYKARGIPKMSTGMYNLIKNKFRMALQRDVVSQKYGDRGRIFGGWTNEEMKTQIRMMNQEKNYDLGIHIKNIDSCSRNDLADMLSEMYTDKLISSCDEDTTRKFYNCNVENDEILFEIFKQMKDGIGDEPEKLYTESIKFKDNYPKFIRKKGSTEYPGDRDGDGDGDSGDVSGIGRGKDGDSGDVSGKDSSDKGGKDEKGRGKDGKGTDSPEAEDSKLLVEYMNERIKDLKSANDTQAYAEKIEIYYKKFANDDEFKTVTVQDAKSIKILEKISDDISSINTLFDFIETLFKGESLESDEIFDNATVWHENIRNSTSESDVMKTVASVMSSGFGFMDGALSTEVNSVSGSCTTTFSDIQNEYSKMNRGRKNTHVIATFPKHKGQPIQQEASIIRALSGNDTPFTKDSSATVKVFALENSKNNPHAYMSPCVRLKQGKYIYNFHEHPYVRNRKHPWICVYKKDGEMFKMASNMKKNHDDILNLYSSYMHFNSHDKLKKMRDQKDEDIDFSNSLYYLELLENDPNVNAIFGSDECREYSYETKGGMAILEGQ